MIFQIWRMLRKRTIKDRLPQRIEKYSSTGDGFTVPDEVVMKAGRIRNRRTIDKLLTERRVNHAELARQLRRERQRINYGARFMAWLRRMTGVMEYEPRPTIRRSYTKDNSPIR